VSFQYGSFRMEPLNSNELAFWQGVIFAFFIVILKLTYCFVGYLIIKVGASLLREGVKGDFKFNAKLQGVKADLVSASPGLFFALLGAFVICYALFVNKPVGTDFSDGYEKVNRELGDLQLLDPGDIDE